MYYCGLNLWLACHLCLLIFKGPAEDTSADVGPKTFFFYKPYWCIARSHIQYPISPSDLLRWPRPIHVLHGRPHICLVTTADLQGFLKPMTTS